MAHVQRATLATQRNAQSQSELLRVLYTTTPEARAEVLYFLMWFSVIVICNIEAFPIIMPFLRFLLGINVATIWSELVATFIIYICRCRYVDNYNASPFFFFFYRISLKINRNWNANAKRNGNSLVRRVTRVMDVIMSILQYVDVSRDEYKCMYSF